MWALLGPDPSLYIAIDNFALRCTDTEMQMSNMSPSTSIRDFEQCLNLCTHCSAHAERWGVEAMDKRRGATFTHVQKEMQPRALLSSQSSVNLGHWHEPALPHAQTEQIETWTRKTADNQAHPACGRDLVHLHKAHLRWAHHAISSIHATHVHCVWHRVARRDDVTLEAGNTAHWHTGYGLVTAALLRPCNLDDCAWPGTFRACDIHQDAANVGLKGLPWVDT